MIAAVGWFTILIVIPWLSFYMGKEKAKTEQGDTLRATCTAYAAQAIDGEFERVALVADNDLAIAGISRLTDVSAHDVRQVIEAFFTYCDGDAAIDVSASDFFDGAA